jgi:hypothetical protein
VVFASPSTFSELSASEPRPASLRERCLLHGHANDSNTEIHRDLDTDSFEIRALRDIAQGEELTQTYKSIAWRASGRAYLWGVVWGGDRITGFARCEQAEAARRRGLRRADGAGEIQIEWVPDSSLRLQGQDGGKQLRYKVTGREKGKVRIDEGVLGFRYDNEARRYHVACPEGGAAPTPSEPSVDAGPSDPGADSKIDAVRCTQDSDCPVLSCGPCDAGAMVTRARMKIRCRRNPCPKASALCRSGVCVVHVGP